MNLLFITGDYPHPYAPANGLFNQYLTTGLALEHSVRVVCPIPWTTVYGARARGAARANPAPEPGARMGVYHPTYFYPPKLLRNQYGSFLWWSMRGQVRRLLREFRPDIVLAYWAHPDGEVAVRIARKLGVPSGVIVGGSDVLVITKNAGRRRKVAAALKKTDAVITVNAHLKKAAVDLGVSENKIHIWNQGVDEKFVRGDRREARARLGISPSGPMAVWVGRMVPVKGLELLIAACTTIKRAGVDFSLYLVGDGPLRKELEADVAAKGLGENIHFAGTQLHDRLPDWYRAADLTVLSSRSEGLPNVLRESLACGTPFVSTRVGGIAELADERTDWLVAPGDAEAFGTAMMRMFKEPGPFPASFRPLTWTQSARALMEIFRPLAAPLVPKEALQPA